MAPIGGVSVTPENFGNFTLNKIETAQVNNELTLAEQALVEGKLGEIINASKEKRLQVGLQQKIGEMTNAFKNKQSTQTVDVLQANENETIAPMEQKLQAKIEEIKSLGGKEWEQQAQAVEASFALLDEREKDAEKRNKIKEYILSMEYGITNGKRTVKCEVLENRPRQIDDTELEDANEKFGLKIKRGNGIWKGVDFHNEADYADRNYYDYYESGLKKVDKELRARYIPHPNMYKQLIRYLGADADYTGILVSKLFNLGYPGVRTSSGDQLNIGDRFSVLSSEQNNVDYVITLYGSPFGNVYADRNNQNNARTLRCFEDSAS